MSVFQREGTEKDSKITAYNMPLNLNADEERVWNYDPHRIAPIISEPNPPLNDLVKTLLYSISELRHQVQVLRDLYE